MKKRKSTAVSQTTAENLESRFDSGKNVLDYFDADGAIRRINVDVPEWVLHGLDVEARRRGITRQSLIKTWLVDHLDEINRQRRAKTA
jgi:hypothetical protein